MSKVYTKPEISVSDVEFKDVVLASSALTKIDKSQNSINKTFNLKDF